MIDAPFSLARLAFLVAFAGVVSALIVVRFEQLHQLYDSDPAPETKTNCPACGARIPIDSDVCSHCGESVTDDTSDYGWIDD